jgi:hypothetical protein
MASSELVDIVKAAFTRRKPFVRADGDASTKYGMLDAALARLDAERSSASASSSDIAAARADVTAAAYDVARVGADLSDMPIRRLHDVNAYGHLGTGPLSGFSAAELFNGVAAMVSSDEKVVELLTAIANEAVTRVDEFPVHALADMADAFIAAGAEAKSFVRAATASAAKRAHLAKLEHSFKLMTSAANAGVGCQELSQEAGTTLAASQESALGVVVMDRAQLVDRVCLVLSTASPDFVRIFAPWVAHVIRTEAEAFESAEQVERLVTAVERAGVTLDREARRAVARAAAARAKREEAQALNGFSPEDYGIASADAVARH